MDDNNSRVTGDKLSGIDKIQRELADISPSTKKRALEKFGLAALGSIPWVGGFISAAASLKTEENTLKTDTLQTKWLEEHEVKMRKLGETLTEISQGFERLGKSVDERIESEEFLELVRKSFRTWDAADTDEKRKYIANLIGNASSTHICSDDIVRLFIDWLGLYHESHFSVIREIYKQPGVTRYDIWTVTHGAIPREDSAEADLYKLLIRDLSTGGVIRQARDTNTDGQFIKRKAVPKRAVSKTAESAFETTKSYVLTELGKQFVHYTMNDVVTRIE